MSRRSARSRRGGEAAAGHDSARDRWLISYADLLTLLFALFVVLFAASDSERAKRVASAIAAQLGGGPAVGTEAVGKGVMPASDAFVQASESVEQAFANDPSASQRVHIRKEERGLIVSLAEAGFFAPGTSEVRDDALSTVDKIATALDKSDVTVRVEGHTDATPISTSRFPSNWELSAARASSVAARLMQRGVAPGRLSIVGYGGERPIADNTTPEGRAQNRRVDIVILKNEH